MVLYCVVFLHLYHSAHISGNSVVHQPWIVGNDLRREKDVGRDPEGIITCREEGSREEGSAFHRYCNRHSFGP